jgi:hypothetical protein
MTRPAERRRLRGGTMPPAGDGPLPGRADAGPGNDLNRKGSR